MFTTTMLVLGGVVGAASMFVGMNAYAEFRCSGEKHPAMAAFSMACATAMALLAGFAVLALVVLP